MKKITEKLWEIYKTEQNFEISDEKKRLNREIIFQQQKLIETMTPKQIKIFRDYEENAGKRTIICEKDSFAAGVRVALSFILDI